MNTKLLRAHNPTCKIFKCLAEAATINAFQPLLFFASTLAQLARSTFKNNNKSASLRENNLKKVFILCNIDKQRNITESYTIKSCAYPYSTQITNGSGLNQCCVTSFVCCMNICSIGRENLDTNKKSAWLVEPSESKKYPWVKNEVKHSIHLFPGTSALRNSPPPPVNFSYVLLSSVQYYHDCLVYSL